VQTQYVYFGRTDTVCVAAEACNCLAEARLLQLLLCGLLLQHIVMSCLHPWTARLFKRLFTQSLSGFTVTGHTCEF
jgi:hypothetical protein